MSKNILAYACYAIRAFGLFLVICTSLFLVASPLIATKASLVGVATGILVLASAVLSWPRLPDAWRRDPPTERQLEYAESLGLVIPEEASKGEVSQMISQITGR